MRIVVATDAIGWKQSAIEVCASMVSGAKDLTEVQSFPLTRGGEGTVTCLQVHQIGEWIACQVRGGGSRQQVEAGFLWVEETKTAVIELARALGLSQFSEEERKPLAISSVSAGELLIAARDRGAEKIFLAVGDCVCADLGTGCATALGWQFQDVEGHPVEPVGQNLLKMRTIIPPEQAWDTPVTVLCDVSNPLLGLHGAAKALAPKQGASRAEVVLLEVGMMHLDQCLGETCEVEIGHAAGGGAGGGLAAGAAVFVKAELVSGAQTMMDMTGANAAMAGADYVLTTTACLDRASLGETVLSEVVTSCQEQKVPAIVFTKQVDLQEQQWQECGIHAVVEVPVCEDEDDEDRGGGLTTAVRDWMKQVCES